MRDVRSADVVVCVTFNRPKALNTFSTDEIIEPPDIGKALTIERARDPLGSAVPQSRRP
jgi:hypothetical protein